MIEPSAELATAPGGDLAGGPGAPVTDETDRRRRRRLLILLFALLAGLLLVIGLALWYLFFRQPLPIIPDVTRLPHYLYSIYGVDGPVGVAVTPSGDRIYVAESGGERLLKVFEPSGDELAATAPADSQVGLRSPLFAARDPKTAEIYVTDRLAGAIYVFSASGDFVRRYVPPAGYEDWNPIAIAFDEDGILYVTDVRGAPARHAMLVIDRDGSLVRTVDRDGKLSYPNGIATTAAGEYVVDSNNSLLVFAAPDGSTRLVVGPGVSEGDLGLPRGAVADGDLLYVADATSHTVNVYKIATDPAGTLEYLGRLGGQGSGDGQFEFPNGVAVDDRGRLYVADRGNARVQVWGY